MRARLTQFWEQLQESLWFLPSLITLAATALAIVLIQTELTDGQFAVEVPWIYEGSASSAESLLSVIASTTITVMGVVFSVTIVALTLTSTQFTPRVLYTFTRDRGTQITMGVFIATYVYALIVLRSVRDAEEGAFVPETAVTGAMGWAVASVIMLIYFIDHLSHSIRASSVIERIWHLTRPLMDRIYPDEIGAPFVGPAVLDELAYASVAAPASGYLQHIEGEALLALARRHDVVVRTHHGPGDFVAAGSTMLTVTPAERLTPKLSTQLADTVVLGRERSIHQDPEFGVRQLMDIAVKALSPGINDPTTAIGCIDYLGALLRRAALHPDPNPRRADAEGRLRLVLRGATFTTLVGHGFDQIRQHARGDVAVTLRLLHTLGDIGLAVDTDDRREVLWRQGAALARQADEHIASAIDRESVNEHLRYLGRVVGRDPSTLLLASEPPVAALS